LLMSGSSSGFVTLISSRHFQSSPLSPIFTSNLVSGSCFRSLQTFGIPLFSSNGTSGSEEADRAHQAWSAAFTAIIWLGLSNATVVS
jgi:hypothetical protein